MSGILRFQISRIKLNIRLDFYDLEKIEVYSIDDCTNEERLLLEDCDYEVLFENNCTVINIICNKKVSSILIIRDNTRTSNIIRLRATYYDSENKTVASMTIQGDQKVYSLKF